MKKFEGFDVPFYIPTTQQDYCDSFCQVNDCLVCLFDYDRPETKEPFERWLEEKGHFTKDLKL